MKNLKTEFLQQQKMTGLGETAFYRNLKSSCRGKILLSTPGKQRYTWQSYTQVDNTESLFFMSYQEKYGRMYGNIATGDKLELGR